MSGEIEIKVAVVSRLRAGTDEVWEWISTLDGVNLEMDPWLDMTAPPGSDFNAAATGEVLPLKLRGPLGLPLGTYPLRLLRMTEGEGFLEQTRMLPFFLWRHERTLRPATVDGINGTTITDELGWKWRFGFLDRLVAGGVRHFFNQRHRTLRKHFGEA